MGNFNRDDRSAGGFRGGFARGGGRGGFSHRGGDRNDRPMFDATCSNCGKPCQVPFRPTNGKPVYCSDCFEKMGGRSDSRRFDDRGRAPQAQNGPDLGAINAKLDKILNILQPKVTVPIIPTPIVKGKKTEPVIVKDSGEAKEEKTKSPEPVERIVEEVKPVKAKKVVKKVASKKEK